MSAKRLEDLPSIRRLALRDLDAVTLQALIDHGEDLVVERKREPPTPPKFGAAAASFANTIGGLILLGVNDDKTIHGWDPGDRVDLQSHLGQLLRTQVDPLPPFVAERFEIDGKPVVVMRIFESADAPHLVRGTGALYTRTSAGKVPVDDQRMLLELAQRGRDALEAGRQRLSEPMVVSALQEPDQVRARSGEDVQTLQVSVRAALVTVPPSFTAWPISKAGAAWATVSAHKLLPKDGRGWAVGAGGAPIESVLSPQPRGVIADDRVLDLNGGMPFRQSIVVADSAGTLGVALRRKYGPDYASIPLSYLEETVACALERIEKALFDSESIGRVVCRLTLYLPAQGGINEQRRAPQRLFWADGEFSAPPGPGELNELIGAWMREYGRACGLEQWES